MQEHVDAHREATLEELLGTYLQVSARHTPPSYSIRSVAAAFGEWTTQPPLNRRASVYDHHVKSRLEPEDIIVSPSPHH